MLCNLQEISSQIILPILNNLTYIFGAGASCQSMPLVTNFKDRFQVFLKYLKDNDLNARNLEINSIDFINQIKAHASLDTFFKKLFHQQKKPEILEYKKVLLIYFLFEQLINVDDYNEYSGKETKKEFNIDPRYDALIAGLLKPISETREFYSNITFCTWNYDMNLLCALKNFIHRGYTMFDLIENIREGNLFTISKQVNVCHLNGFIYHPLLNNMTINAHENKNAFNSLTQNFESSDLEEYAAEIKFSWEQNNPIPDVIIEGIKSSSTVIIIGYSLPLYNRLFDHKLLNEELLSGKELIIQDIKATNISQIIESEFDMPFKPVYKGGTHVKLYENCNSFFVPSKIFR